MTHFKKANMLKDTIVYLYEKEGRSKDYISQLLKIDYKIICNQINEWELIKADKKYLIPSTRKFLNKHKKEIIDGLDAGLSLVEIATRLNITVNSLAERYIKNDKELLHHHNLWRQRKNKLAKENLENEKEESSRDYSENLPNEIWKDILGYDGYQVSNKGRVRRYTKKYDEYFVMKLNYNYRTGRVYIGLTDNNGKRHGISVPRLVAFNFIEGYSDERNTVNHIDGNFQNNCAENLEWVSQSENNQKAFDLGRTVCKAYGKYPKFKKIILDDKYEFKTIAALAKFLGMSETQTRRYIDGACKSNHTFKFIR